MTPVFRGVRGRPYGFLRQNSRSGPWVWRWWPFSWWRRPSRWLSLQSSARPMAQFEDGFDDRGLALDWELFDGGGDAKYLWGDEQWEPRHLGREPRAVGHDPGDRQRDDGAGSVRRSLADDSRRGRRNVSTPRAWATARRRKTRPAWMSLDAVYSGAWTMPAEMTGRSSRIGWICPGAASTRGATPARWRPYSTAITAQSDSLSLFLRLLAPANNPG